MLGLTLPLSQYSADSSVSATSVSRSVFTVQRYAGSAFADVMYPPVCPSVTSRFYIEMTGRIELVFGTGASFYLFQIVL